MRTLRIVFCCVLYLILPGFLAWATGNAFIFPSLGPTAYLLAFDTHLSHSVQVVLGGHLCGVAGGLASYHLMVDPFNLMQLTEGFSAAGVWLAFGCMAALALTAFLMLLFDVSHPPACATTLIVSLGILPEWIDGVYILVAVALMYATYWISQKWLNRSGKLEKL